MNIRTAVATGAATIALLALATPAFADGPTPATSGASGSSGVVPQCHLADGSGEVSCATTTTTAAPVAAVTPTTVVYAAPAASSPVATGPPPAEADPPTHPVMTELPFTGIDPLPPTLLALGLIAVGLCLRRLSLRMR